MRLYLLLEIASKLKPESHTAIKTLQAIAPQQYEIVEMVYTTEIASTVVSYFDLMLSKAGEKAFKLHPCVYSKNKTKLILSSFTNEMCEILQNLNCQIELLMWLKLLLV